MLRRLASALVVATVTVTPLAAQDVDAPLPRIATSGIAVTGGASTFDLSGTGTATIFGLRAYGELGSRFVVGELGLSTMSPREQFDRRVTYLAPEAQLQVQLPFAGIRPYLGIGVGSWVSTQAGDDRRTRMAVSGAVGMRLLPQAAPVGLVLEGRLRGIGEGFGGATADLNAGLAWHF